MGASSIFMDVPTTNEKRVISAFKKRVRNDQYEYGHNEYSGTFATFSGLNLKLDQQFESRAKAEDYILERSDKWGNAIGVVVKFGNKKYTLIGGWVAE